MCIKTKFQCMNPDCLERDTRHNVCMTPTTCTTAIEIVEKADGCCKCIYKDEQGPCVHRARQLHPGEVAHLQTTSHLATSAGADVEVFESSDEESSAAVEGRLGVEISPRAGGEEEEEKDGEEGEEKKEGS